ncbi:MAG TPA: ABC transporter ATP-binding protein [Clostridiales bacterium]|nr:ABC transporter ATP-binding protein [Clostridiales bacterium]
MANVRLESIKKIYPHSSETKKRKKGEPREQGKANLQITDKGVVAVQDFSLEIADQEFIVLVGPSGCGKSTTLRMVAGLEEISDGKLYIDDVLVNDVAPKDRDIAMVFQNYALYPHMTVFENMAFALKLRKEKKEVIQQKVTEAARTLEIEDLLSRKPKALSGGQRQRVAIGRAIVRNPKVFLMDEPLSNLDAKLRNQMRAEIILLRKKIDTTFIYVTHDQTEAMTLGDRIVIMKDGVIQQIGTPHEVFNRPLNLFVAGFIGTPQMNFFDGRLAIQNGQYHVHVYNADILLTDEMQAALKAKNAGEDEVTVGIRPEHIMVSNTDSPDVIESELSVSEMMGSEIYLHVDVGGGHVDVQNKEAVIRIPVTDAADEYSSANTGHTSVKFRLHPGLLHLFDKTTGESILSC